MGKDDTIIELSEKRRKKQMAQGIYKEEDKTQDVRKWTAMSVVFGVVFTVALVNYQLIQNSESDVSLNGSRNIASAHPQNHDQWVQWLEKNNNKKRSISSIASRPSPLDQLSMGLLEGKYMVRLHQGKLKNIQFSDMGDDRPKYIRNRAEFINSHRNIFPVEFASVKLEEDVVVEDQLAETYLLYDKSQQVVGKAEFKMDTYGRLLSLEIR